MGINLGDMIIFDTPFEESADGTRFMAKSIDNRYGCALSLELIDELLISIYHIT